MTKQSIGPVLALSGTVEASPTYQMNASKSGQVRYLVKTGSQVARHQTLAVIAGEPIYAPTAGWVTERLVPDGLTVAAELPILRVKSAGFAIAAQVPMADVYRVYDGAEGARAEIDNGPGPFDCTLVTPGPDGGDAADGSSSKAFLCAVPNGVHVYEGMSATLAISFAVHRDVLALPVQAVAGSAESGTVTLVSADGSRSEKQIALGVTDGAYVEVRTGLSEGDRVMAASPQLRPAE